MLVLSPLSRVSIDLLDYGLPSQSPALTQSSEFLVDLACIDPPLLQNPYPLTSCIARNYCSVVVMQIASFLREFLA
jgi:hypothetical protein